MSAEIAKGEKGRTVPVAPELETVVERIRRMLESDDYALPHQYWADPGICEQKADDPKKPSSSQALRKLMQDVAKRAGIPGRIYPHQMRHAFGEQMVRHAGMRNTQAMMGHADGRTTEIYAGSTTLDDLIGSISGFRIGIRIEQTFYPPNNVLANPVEAPTGIEPV